MINQMEGTVIQGQIAGGIPGEKDLGGEKSELLAFDLFLSVTTPGFCDQAKEVIHIQLAIHL